MNNEQKEHPSFADKGEDPDPAAPGEKMTVPLSALRDYHDWLENTPPVDQEHVRGRRLLVFVLVVAALVLAGAIATVLRAL